MASGKTTRVLVLEGGGAKGAYSFGALLAFKACGIEFDAVSGTSVGALNAVLWSSDCLEAGRALWESISFENTYPVKIADPKRHSRTFIVAVSSAWVLLQLALATSRGVPSEFELPIRFVLATFRLLYFTLLPYLFFPHKVAWVGFLFWLLSLGNPQDRGTRERRAWVVRTFFVIVAVGLLYEFAMKLGVFGIASDHVFLICSLFLTLAGVAVAATVDTVAVLTEKIYTDGLKAGELLGRSPLAKILIDILQHHPLKIQTIVTSSILERAHDPDRGRTKVPIGEITDFYWRGRRVAPTEVDLWVPVYHDITNMPVGAQVNCCLASAALPFGIVGPIKTRNSDADLVDGGIADNCPLAPFQNEPKIDEAFVVSLQPYSSREAASKAAADPDKFRRILRSLDLTMHKGPRVNPERDNDPPIVVPYQTMRYCPRVIPFYPSSSLGGFVNGTLMFDSKYTEPLITRGIRETLERLQEMNVTVKNQPEAN
jgi:predicted acylesterase/phospholipase RssA